MMACSKRINISRINSNRSYRELLNKNQEVPDELFSKCPGCKHTIYQKDLGSDRVCLIVSYTFRIAALERLSCR